MPEPTSLVIGLKEAIIGGLALFGFNIAGWRLFGRTKLKQIDEIDKRVTDIERNHVPLSVVNALGNQLNDKLDHLTERIDKLYERNN